MHRNQSLDAPILVGDKGDPCPGGLELVEDRQRPGTLGHDGCGFDRLRELGRFARDHPCPEVRDGDDAEQVVQMLAVDREIYVPGLDHLSPVLLEGVLHVHGHDVGTRGHQHADPSIAEAEDALYHILFRLLEDAGPGGLPDENADILFSNLGARRLPDTERPEHRLG